MGEIGCINVSSCTQSNRTLDYHSSVFLYHLLMPVSSLSCKTIQLCSPSAQQFCCHSNQTNIKEIPSMVFTVHHCCCCMFMHICVCKCEYISKYVVGLMHSVVRVTGPYDGMGYKM